MGAKSKENLGKDERAPSPIGPLQLQSTQRAAKNYLLSDSAPLNGKARDLLRMSWSTKVQREGYEVPPPAHLPRPDSIFVVQTFSGWCR